MFKKDERRRAPRFAVSVPLRIRFGNEAAPEELLASINLSERGVYFETSSPVQKGLSVHLTFEMPMEITGVPDAQWNCVGEIVRVEDGKTPGKAGVGIRIDHWKL